MTHGPTARRWSPAAVVAGALATVGVVAALWGPWAPQLPAAITDLTTFPPDVVEAIGAYRPPRIGIAMAARILAVAVPVLVLIAPGGRRLVRAIAGDGTRWSLARGFLLAATISLLVWLAVLPMAAWAGLVQDGTWGFRTAPAGLWWRDRILAGFLNAVMAGVVGVAILAVVRRRPTSWPWHATWLVTAIVGVVSFLWPVVIAPLFVPTRPLVSGPIHDAVSSVLERAGMQDASIEVGLASTRTTRINAFVAGLGPTRRVVLHDTLLERPIDEIEVVVAHELGHRLHRDVARGVLASAPGILVGALLLRRVLNDGRLQRRVGATHPADPRMIAVGFAAVALFSAVAEPVALWHSRRVETAADHRALVLSDDPAAVVGVTRAFVIRDLAAPDPPSWQVALLSTHPPVGSRIRHAAAYARLHGIPLPDLATYERREDDIGVPWQQ